VNVIVHVCPLGTLYFKRKMFEDYPGNKHELYKHIDDVLGASLITLPGPSCSLLDNAIHLINHYPVDSVVCFLNTYPLDSDLSGG